MNRIAIKFLLLAPLLAILPRPVSGTTTVGHLDLEFIAKKAGVIFAGTVDSVRYGMDPLGQTALTRVYFGNIVYAKGGPGPTPLVLTLRGGKTAKYEFCVIGQPTFESSKRYIVLARADLGSVKNMYLPIIGLDAGFFPVIRDSSAAGACVHDSHYLPITRIKGRHIVVIDRMVEGAVHIPPYRDLGGEPPIEVLSPSEDPGLRVGEGEFLRAVHDLGK